MSLNKLHIDDSNPLMFSKGTWYQENDYGGASQRTRSLTRESGAYRTVRFIGTSIAVFGGLQPLESATDYPLEVQFAIDNGPRKVYTPKPPARYTNASYFLVDDLPMGEHVLMIMNMIYWDSLWLDYFEIGASAGETPQLLLSDGSFMPVPQTVAPSSSVSANLSTQSAPSSTTSHNISTTSSVSVSESSSTEHGTTPLSTLLSSQSASLSVTLSSPSLFGNLSTVPITSPAPMTTYETTVINAANNVTNSLNRKAIIASASCGALAVIVIILLVFRYLYKRRQHRKQIQALSRPCLPSPGRYHHTSAYKIVALTENLTAQPANPSTISNPSGTSSIQDIHQPDTRCINGEGIAGHSLPPYEA